MDHLHLFGVKLPGENLVGVGKPFIIGILPYVGISMFPVNVTHAACAGIMYAVYLFSERRVPQEGLNKYFVRAKRVSHPLQYNVLVLQQIADGIFSDTHPLSSFFKLKCCLSAVVAYFMKLEFNL